MKKSVRCKQVHRLQKCSLSRSKQEHIPTSSSQMHKQHLTWKNHKSFTVWAPMRFHVSVSYLRLTLRCSYLCRVLMGGTFTVAMVISTKARCLIGAAHVILVTCCLQPSWQDEIQLSATIEPRIAVSSRCLILVRLILIEETFV